MSKTDSAGAPGERDLPVVQVLTMGGTISARIGSGGGYDPALGGGELLEGLGLEQICEVRVAEFGRALSFGVTFEEIAALVQRLEAVLSAPDVNGAVVTQGTAALEEVAFLCDLALDSSRPVVFTGATYNASDPGSDGPHNVRDAVRVAASEASAGRGVLVCFGGEIFSAREVQKLHKYSPTAFTSTAGPLGIVDAGDVYYYRPPQANPHLPFPQLPLPRVELIKAVIDMDDLLLRAALKAPAAGIVLEGLPGSGGLPPALLPAIESALQDDIPVVLASRAPFGRITPVAAGESGPRVLADMGVIMSGHLSAPKARLLLALALGNGKSQDEVRDIFEQVGRPGRRQ